MRLFTSLAALLLLVSCEKAKEADLIIHHAKIYTADSVFSEQEAMAVKDGKIIGIGSNQYIQDHFNAKETRDAQSKFIFPGFIDAHCHFFGYGKGLKELDLVGTNSFAEVIVRLVEYSKNNADGWIVGRGWDQNDWADKNFPDRKKLDSIFPDRPVFLKRVDGHAALANKKALKLAHICDTTKVKGGMIQSFLGKDDSWTIIPRISACGNNCKYWEPTGILIDNAVDLVENKIPPLSGEQVKEALLEAQKNCLEAGLTTVDDAGLEKRIVDAIDKLQKDGEMKIRVYAMLTPSKENLDHYLKTGIYKTDKLNVRSFKFYADGALGSRGAYLFSDYSDKKDWKGFMLNDLQYYKDKAELMAQQGFQMNTHCIGDQAVSIILDIYSNIIKAREGKEKVAQMMPASERENSDPKMFNGEYSDLRWRIEHAQVVDPKDINKFSRKIIPSVQPTHATSDMYWAEERLGKERVKHAYAYKELLNASGLLALGTDFPVEDVSPIKTFYAAVYRKDAKGFPVNGFQMENALSRKETLLGMTRWAAYSNFEEKEKGSLEYGKWADFVILDTDLMTCPREAILKAKVLETFIGGESVFKK
jgi:hypothetical protein